MSRNSRRARIDELDNSDRSPDELAAGLKERVYATFTGLAILLAVQAHGSHFDPTEANISLIIGVAGITLAGFVSDILSHLTVHRSFPNRRKVGHLLWVAFSALGSLVLPGITLALASFDVIEADLSARIAITALIVTLAVIVLLAVRRSGLTFVRQLLAIVMLTALGGAVIALELLAHG